LSDCSPCASLLFHLPATAADGGGGSAPSSHK
jgi:hypothetical protein